MSRTAFRTRTASRDGGSATVLVLAAGGVLVLLGSLLGVGGVAGLDRQRAAAAADLAALAAAADPGGAEQACRRAARVAAANGARLTDCRAFDTDGSVRVEVEVPLRLGPLGSLPGPDAVRVAARAGPELPVVARADDLAQQPHRRVLVQGLVAVAALR